MRVAMQVSDLDHARIDGTRVYVRELLKRFGAFAPDVEFLLYHRNTFNPLLAPSQRSNYHEQALPFPVAWMQTRFAWDMFRAQPDRLFLPIQAAPVFLPSGLSVTATIHDLAFRRFPETFPSAHLHKLNFMLETVVRQADKLIAVSESTKHDLLEFFPHLDERRVRVIHHGYDADFFGQHFPGDELADQLEQYGLRRGEYILSVGAIQPRKNLIRLIHAFELAKQTSSNMRLVLAGEPAWLSEGILDVVQESPYRSDIIQTGRVNFTTLRVLYQGARFLAFPSLYEGFGLPILEAYASGLPVLTADNSSLREVAGSGALYVQADDITDMAEKLGILWTDAPLRRQLGKQAQHELGRFSWDRAARETLDYILC